MRIPSGPEAVTSSHTGRIYGRNPDLLLANSDEIILQTGMGPYMGDPNIDQKIRQSPMADAEPSDNAILSALVPPFFRLRAATLRAES